MTDDELKLLYEQILDDQALLMERGKHLSAEDILPPFDELTPEQKASLPRISKFTSLAREVDDKQNDIERLYSQNEAWQRFGAEFDAFTKKYGLLRS